MPNSRCELGIEAGLVRSLSVEADLMPGLLPDGVKPRQPSRVKGTVRAPPNPLEKRFNRLRCRGLGCTWPGERPKVDGLPWAICRTCSCTVQPRQLSACQPLYTQTLSAPQYPIRRSIWLQWILGAMQCRPVLSPASWVRLFPVALSWLLKILTGVLADSPRIKGKVLENK